MATFQLLSCNVAIGGDVLNVVARHAYSPVTYPELLTLKYLHGENSVTDVYDVGHVDRDPAQETARLISIYGATTIKEKMFPGSGNRLPEGDNAFGRDPGIKKRDLPKQPADLPSPLNAGIALSPEGPGTASTTPVAYGGVAEQTGGGYMPNAQPGNLVASAPDAAGKQDSTVDDGGGIVIDPLTEYAVPYAPPVNSQPAELRTIQRKPKEAAVKGKSIDVSGDVPGGTITGGAEPNDPVVVGVVGDKAVVGPNQASKLTKGADAPQPEVTVGPGPVKAGEGKSDTWADKIG